MTARFEEIHFVVPGRIDQATGGYRYDKHMIEGLRARGHEVIVHELAGRFPLADETARRDARQAIAAIGPALTVIDGLALMAFEGALGGAKRVIALVHHPLARETGLDSATRRSLARREAALWRETAGAIVTSSFTANELAGAGVAPRLVSVVMPGTERRSIPVRRRPGAARLLCVATLVPRKGHAVLLRALARLRRCRWRLDCIGSTSRDPRHAAMLRAMIRLARLGRRVRLVGEVSSPRLEAAYRRADIFTLASYHEGYGMVVAEALARGLPVVATSAGAILTSLPRHAAHLVQPGNARALAAALRAAIDSPRVRHRLTRRALAAARRLPRWPEQVARFEAALRRLAS